MAQYSRKLKKGQGIRWWYKFDYKKKTYSSKCKYLSKNEAKKAEKEHIEELEQKTQKPSQKPVLSLLQAINERLDYVEVKKTPDYFKTNKLYYSILLKHFGNIKINEIKKKDIRELLLKQSIEGKKRGRKNYTVNAMLNVFKALFSYSIDNHEFEFRNPCLGIEPFPVEKKIKYIPSDEDIEAVKSLCDEGQRMLIDFVMETGARINEPLKIVGKDILEKHVVLYTKKSKNSNLVPRKVPKPECIAQVHIQSDERLFVRWIDAPKFLEKKVKKLKQEKWGWHNLRHRRASLWNKEGKSLLEIMLLLGHSNLSTTQNYFQLLP